MKLYRVTLKGCGEYHFNYVIANNLNEAYLKIKSYLDKYDYLFEKDRELEKIELLADEEKFSNCNQLFLAEKKNAK